MVGRCAAKAILGQAHDLWQGLTAISLAAAGGGRQLRLPKKNENKNNSQQQQLFLGTQERSILSLVAAIGDSAEKFGGLTGCLSGALLDLVHNDIGGELSEGQVTTLFRWVWGFFVYG